MDVVKLYITIKDIDNLIAKDNDTFTIIYNTTKTAVFSIIYAIIHDQEKTKDLMQDTYITMLEKIHTFNYHKNFLTWLLTIARNKAIDQYRHDKFETLYEVKDIDLLTRQESKSENKLLIEEKLAKLNETERSIFLLKVVNGLKIKEISQIMQMPMGTISWHLQKILKKVRDEKNE